MKKVLWISILSTIAVSSHGFASDLDSVAPMISDAVLNQMSQPEIAANLVDWKVGDQMNYSLELSIPGFSGKMVKEVTKDEGTAIWITNTVAILSQNQKVEALINKADGKILRMIQNGKEMEVPADDQPEIISSEFTNITVPAGTFQAIHIVAKTKKISRLEIWTNPKDTCMDGSIKNIMPIQFGTVTMLLTSFKKAP